MTAGPKEEPPRPGPGRAAWEDPDQVGRESPGQGAIWDHYQNEGRDFFRQAEPRLRFLARRILRAHPGRAPSSVAVLDVGIGDGTFEEIAHGLGLDVHALDPNERAIRALRGRLPIGDKARVGTSAAMPFETSSLDALVLSEVLEHLPEEDLEKTLEEAGRVLRPGGLLLGTVPAREDLAASLAVCPACAHRFHRFGHTRSFDVDGLRALLARRFEVLELFERPFACWPALNWKGKAWALARLALNRLGVHGSGESLVFVARLERPHPDLDPAVA